MKGPALGATVPAVPPPRRARRTSTTRQCAWAVLPILCLLACPGAKPRDPRPLVVVSVAPQRYVVERLAGELVRVEVMIPPGANPVTHEPSISQLRSLEEAALYVKVGHPSFPFERAWLDRMIHEFPGLAVVDGLGGGGRASQDPHVWLAPRQVEQLAIRVRAALATIVPEQRETLATNLAQFRREIDELDREIRDLLSEASVERFFVLHPAWGHFADAYGLEQIALEHDHKEPDLRRLREFVVAAREDPIAVVFVQPQFDPSAARSLAREVDARVETLDPLAADWPENLRRVARAMADARAD